MALDPDPQPIEPDDAENDAPQDAPTQAEPMPDFFADAEQTTPSTNVAAPVPGAIEAPSWRDRRAAGRLQARKVRRLVRHIEPWSVLKIALVFNFCMWIIMLIAGVVLWRVAESAELINNIEGFIESLFALESFQFDPSQIFRASALGGLMLVVGGTGFAVLMAVLFNLISDLMGGVRITVVEEESARPVDTPYAEITTG